MSTVGTDRLGIRAPRDLCVTVAAHTQTLLRSSGHAASLSWYRLAEDTPASAPSPALGKQSAHHELCI